MERSSMVSSAPSGTSSIVRVALRPSFDDLKPTSIPVNAIAGSRCCCGAGCCCCGAGCCCRGGGCCCRGGGCCRCGGGCCSGPGSGAGWVCRCGAGWGSGCGAGCCVGGSVDGLFVPCPRGGVCGFAIPCSGEGGGAGSSTTIAIVCVASSMPSFVVTVTVASPADAGVSVSVAPDMPTLTVPGLLDSAENVSGSSSGSWKKKCDVHMPWVSARRQCLRGNGVNGLRGTGCRQRDCHFGCASHDIRLPARGATRRHRTIPLSRLARATCKPSP